MTSNNITKIQVIATIDDGSHLIALTDDRTLIQAIVGRCQFAKLKDDLFEQCSLAELID